MKDGKNAGGDSKISAASIPTRILGSLRDALNAASRDATGEITVGERTDILPAKAAAEAHKPAGPQAAAGLRPPEIPTVPPQPPAQPAPMAMTAAEALREAKAPTRGHYEAGGEPTTRAVRPSPVDAKPAAARTGEPPKTQALRGKPKVVRTAFHQDPVVGWLVVVGGPGLGAFRCIYEGNNAIGRAKGQRIPIDFGDDTISSEEQAYIRYDSMDRSFLFVPNLSKTNIVAINNKKPTGAVQLQIMDVITMGRTQLAFVPFCGEEFDWSELADLKE